MPAVGFAISGAVAAFSASGVGTFLTGTITGRLLTSVALSALQAATVRRPRPAGLTNERKGTGSTNPRGFPLGRCATPGDEVCTPMTHGKAGKVRNAYVTFVIALSDVPGVTVNRMWIDNELVTLSTPSADPNLAPYGQRIMGRFDGFAWVKFYDGTQTVADPMLLARYSTYPERPWSADMRLTGCAYAIVTCRWNTTLFRAEPQFLFELNSIPLYDPRKDSTVGGSGAHRWANKATWEPSDNPKVMEYNILRGIEVPNCGIWGGAATAADLPLANWFTAMNECDVAISTLAGTVPQYRAARYVAVNEAPADVINDLNLVCTGQTAELGGTFKTRVGGPGLPVLFIADDDWVVTQQQDFDPFDRADQRPNYFTANYPEPSIAWQPRPAPVLANAAWETEDGGRRETALEFAACPHVAQVQRVMASFAKDTRRARKHGGVLPPDAAMLEPLDCVSWTSTRNGYTGKLFEVSAIDDGARNMLQHPSLREVDPADYGWTPASEVAVTNPSIAPVPVPDFAVPGFAPAAGVILDNTGASRRVSVDIAWDGAEQDGVRAVEWEINLWTGSAVGALVERASTTDVASGLVRRTAGILPQTAYATRIRFVGDFTSPWTAYSVVTTGAVGLGNADFINGLVATLQGLGVSPPERVAALPSTGNYEGRIVILTTNDKIYRHTGAPLDATGWTTSLDGQDLLANSITGNKMAAQTVTAREVAAYALQVQNLAVTAGNLIGNPQFASGSFAAWRPYATPASQSVVVRSAAGVPAGAPTAFVARYNMASPGAQLSTFTGEQAFDVPGREACAIPVIAGERYLMTVDAVRAAGVGNVLCQCYFFWLMADGTDTLALTINTTFPASWTTISGSAVAPVGAVGAWAYMLATHQSGGTGAVFWTNMTMRQMAAGNLIVDGALAVQGMAAFGGTLQSSNFVSGSAGWRLQQSGALEIQNLINRSALTEDSLQDTFQTVNPLYYGTGGAPNIIVAGTVLATLNIGAVANGRLLRRGVNFEVRRPGTVSSFTNPQPRLELQSRKRQFGSGWSNWTTERVWEGVDLYDTGSGVGPWDRRSSGGSISEGFDEFEYRVVVIDPRSYGNNGTWIGNIWLTVAYLTKGA